MARLHKQKLDALQDMADQAEVWRDGNWTPKGHLIFSGLKYFVLLSSVLWICFTSGPDWSGVPIAAGGTIVIAAGTAAWIFRRLRSNPPLQTWAQQLFSCMTRYQQLDQTAIQRFSTFQNGREISAGVILEWVSQEVRYIYEA